MRNYVKYFRAAEFFQADTPPGSGNWVTTFTTWQWGGTIADLEFAISVDQRGVQPDHRLVVGSPEVRYFLLDKEFVLASLSLAAVQDENRNRTNSPKSWWSNGH